MREYGQIQTSFWTDPDIYSLSDQGKLLATYLLTGPHSNGIGCYRLLDGYVQADLNWSPETSSKGFGELLKIGFFMRCDRTLFILIPKFLRYNPISNANVAKARVKEFECVPKESSIYQELCTSMLAYGTHFEKPFQSQLETLSKPVRNRTLPEPTLPKPLPEPIQTSKASGENAEAFSPPPPVNSCPIQKIVALYHEKLPALPQCRKITKAREAAIRQRWREDIQNLDDWEDYFVFIGRSPFLMGKSTPTNGHAKPFIASLDWLVKAENYAKIYEGKYHG